MVLYLYKIYYLEENFGIKLEIFGTVILAVYGVATSIANEYLKQLSSSVYNIIAVIAPAIIMVALSFIRPSYLAFMALMDDNDKSSNSLVSEDEKQCLVSKTAKEMFDDVLETEEGQKMLEQFLIKDYAA